MNVDLRQNYKQLKKQRMKTIQQQRIDRLKKDIEWYKLYADYIEHNKPNWDEYACNYADNKTNEI